MAIIVENKSGRRNIRLNTNDVIDIVREYQNISKNALSYEEIRNRLNKVEFYLPEDII